MEEIGHRGSPNVKICLFLTQQTAHRTAKVRVQLGFLQLLIRFYRNDIKALHKFSRDQYS
tara:strand:- start:761 stop:940 length:180 start_codon:yes stop_codon:yes gene_type:complete